MSDELKYTVFPHVEAKVRRDLRTLRKVLNVPDPADVEAVARVIIARRASEWEHPSGGLRGRELDAYVGKAWPWWTDEATAAIAALIERGWTKQEKPE